MIIQVRGTSGSGKSFIVRAIKERALECKPLYTPGRKQPILYRARNMSHTDPLYHSIIGHYETKCGGCDTISTPGESYDIIFGRVRSEHEAGNNVLFEGLLISGDVSRTSKLADLNPLIIELTTPLSDCLDSVNIRRAERLADKFTPVNPENTVSKHKLIQRSCERLEKDFGIRVERHDRDSAFRRVRELLNA